MKKSGKALFLFAIGLIPISLFLRINDTPGKYIFFAIGIFMICIYFITQIIRDISKERIVKTNFPLQIMSVLMSAILYTRYLHWSYGDYLGLVIIPAYLILVLIYFLKSKSKYIQLTITSILYVLLSIPLFGWQFHDGPRLYIPNEWISNKENHLLLETDSITINSIGNGHEGMVVSIKGSIEFKSEHVKTLYNESDQLYMDGRYSDAKEKLTEAYRQDPYNLPILNYLGLICKRMEQFDEAEIYFLKAIELDNNYIPAYNNLGLSYYYAGEYYKGVKILKLIENRVSSRTSRNTNYYHQAMNYGGLEDCKNAYKYYKLLLRDCDKAVKENIYWFIENEAILVCPNCSKLIEK